MTSTERRKEARYQRRKAKRIQKRDERYKQFDSFDRLLDGNNTYSAYRKCSKGVRYKESQQNYRINLLKNLSAQKKNFQSGQHLSDGFKEFTLVDRGKRRNIRAVSFRERVAQRTLNDESLVHLFQRNLIYDNGASIKGKGNHWCLKRVEAHLHRFYRQNGYSNNGAIAVLDLTGYYDHILHQPLLAIYRKEIHDSNIIRTSRFYIEAFGDGVSVGIGSQISQLSGSRYPSEIDHLIKEQMRYRQYARYNDDSYFIGKDKTALHANLEVIRGKYAELGITLNTKKTQVIALKRGFKFLKTIFYLTETGKVIKKPVRDAVTRERRKLKKLFKKYALGEVSFEAVKQNFESWKSHMAHKDSHKTVSTMQNYFNKLHTEAILLWSKQPTPTNPKKKSTSLRKSTKRITAL